LANATTLDTDLLRRRYEEELSAYVIGPPSKAEGTLDYWIRMIDEIRGSGAA
jgi:hypothetical protein